MPTDRGEPFTCGRAKCGHVLGTLAAAGSCLVVGDDQARLYERATLSCPACGWRTKFRPADPSRPRKPAA